MKCCFLFLSFVHLSPMLFRINQPAIYKKQVFPGQEKKEKNEMNNVFKCLLGFGEDRNNTMQNSKNRVWINKIKMEKSSILHFLKIGYMIIAFCIFVCSYKSLFPYMQSKTLINPLQVLACFLFYYDLQLKERTKHLVIVCFLLCILSSLYLRGIDLQFILVVLIPLFCFFIGVFPGHTIPTSLLLFRTRIS